MPFCPECQSEYREGFDRCASCDVALVSELPDAFVPSEENIRQALEGQALGAKVEVPTLRGEENLEVPAGSQSGKVFRLKNKGIPHLNRSGNGDEVITLRVVTPEKLTEEQRKLFRALADSLGTPKKDKK